MPVLELSRVLQEGDRELKRTLTFRPMSFCSYTSNYFLFLFLFFVRALYMSS
jgi:hypothetical protein